MMVPGGRPLAAHEDEEGNLIVADTFRHVVVRFRGSNFQVLAGGQGAGSGLNQLDGPLGLWYSGGYVYVADTNNHRIVRWSTHLGTLAGQVVFGEGVAGRTLTQLNFPVGVYADGNGTTFVVDYGNARLLSIANGSSPGVPAADVGAGSAPAIPILPSAAMDTFFDGTGNFYNVDYDAQRLNACFRTLTCDFTQCRDVDPLAVLGDHCGCTSWTTQCSDGARGAWPGSSWMPPPLLAPPSVTYVT